MIRTGKLIGGALVVALAVESATAGVLREAEKKASKQSASSAPAAPPPAQPAPNPRAEYRGYDSASTSSYGSGTYPTSGVGESFLAGMFGWLVSSPFRSRHSEFEQTSAEDAEGWAPPPNPLFPDHALGQMTQPYVRADFNWQYIEDNLEAQDLRIEAGYKAIGAHARHTRYIEELVGGGEDELTINQYYAMFRLGFPIPHLHGGESFVEIDAGAGVAQITLLEENSSWAVTVPIKYQYNDWFGVEFRPAWYRWSELMVGDYDASMSLGWRFVQGRLGYRWLWMQSEGHLLNGPYAGLSLAF